MVPECKLEVVTNWCRIILAATKVFAIVWVEPQQVGTIGTSIFNLVAARVCFSCALGVWWIWKTYPRLCIC